MSYIFEIGVKGYLLNWELSIAKQIEGYKIMDRRDNQSPQGQIARILVKFLEVAITSIIFHKGVYPSGAFERRRYMNLVVHKAKHPELEDYIHSAVDGLFPFLEKGFVDRVAVIFFDTESTPLERYNFKLQLNQSYASLLEESDFEFSLRSFLVKLDMSKALAKVLPRDCRWEITAYIRAEAKIGTSNDVKLWIPTDAKQWQKAPLITPLKSMRSDPLALQLYLEHPDLSDEKV